MQEIKFRIWDKKIKKMIYIDNIFIQRYSFIFYFQFYTDQNYLENLIFMQYTGLKDFYEKDLLISHNKNFSDSNSIFSIKFVDCSFVIYNPNCCEECKNGNGYICILNKYDKFEKIGNIYENPELLNK